MQCLSIELVPSIVTKSLYQSMLGGLPAPKFPTSFSQTIVLPFTNIPPLATLAFLPSRLKLLPIRRLRLLHWRRSLSLILVLIIIHPRYPDLNRVRAHKLMAEASALTTVANSRSYIHVLHHRSSWIPKETGSPGKVLSLYFNSILRYAAAPIS